MDLSLRPTNITTTDFNTMAKRRMGEKGTGTTSAAGSSFSETTFVNTVVGKAPPSSADPLGFKLNLMPTEERSNGLYDLHGVADQVRETPEMIRAKTFEMNAALESIIATSKESNNNFDDDDSLAFRKALAKSPEYVQSLKLRFLRADSYNSKESAGRMIRFFNKKMELFGEHKLVDDIKFEDLGKEEVDILNQGIFQLLPQRDRAGRAIIFAYGKLAVDHSIDELLRALYYVVMAALEDEETQKSGIVGIFYGIGQTRIVQGRTSSYWNLWWSLPLRHAGFHYCQNTSALNPTRLIIAKLVECKLLCRVRYHFGSEMECIYNLMTFGIAREAIPISEGGELELTNHHELLQRFKCREKLRDGKIWNAARETSPPPLPRGRLSTSSLVSLDDSSSTSTTTTSTHVNDCEINNSQKSAPSCTRNAHSLQNIISVPGPMDILLGRGRRQEKRPGMVKFNSLLEEYWDDYEAASKIDKTEIAKLVLKQMKESKCRFLVAVPEGFQECDEPMARERIAHSFRTLRGKKRVTNNKPNTTTKKPSNKTTTSSTKDVVEVNKKTKNGNGTKRGLSEIQYEQ